MDQFGYLSVLLSIIVGLAITQLLQGFRGMVLSRSRIRLYAPTLTWSGLLVLIAVQSWWAMFGLRDRTRWTFLDFAVVLLQMILLYMLAALVLPDFTGDERDVDLKLHYYQHRRVFFGVAIANTLVSLTKDVILTGHLPDAANVRFHLIFIATAAVAMLTAREWYHRLLAPALLLVFCLYVGLLFTQLHA
jgi:hypothetical protein